jgi:NAD(P)-dependent dehydrogenase (short-subunit alcohol dehydrogenase family)
VARQLEGRAALITGASQGLGKEIAAAYLREGASIAICARDARMLETVRSELAPLATGGQKILARPCDVSKREQVEALVEHAVATFPELDILVNSAGVYGPKGPSETVDWDAWVQAIEIDLFGAVLLCRAIIPQLKKRGGGKIIQLSGGGATAPLARLSAYATAKAAVVRFCETIAVELKDDKIDVNCIAPGALNTRMLEEILEAGPDVVGTDFYARSLKQKESGGVPLDKGAGLAVFLAAKVSDGITGKLLSAIWDPWQDLPDRVNELAGSDIYTLRRIVPGDRGKDWGDKK